MNGHHSPRTVLLTAFEFNNSGGSISRKRAVIIGYRSYTPTEYVRTFYTDTVANTPASLRMAIDFYGIDRVLFASDFPWWTPRMGIEFVRANLDAEEAEKVLGRNVDELFGREQ